MRRFPGCLTRLAERSPARSARACLRRDISDGTETRGLSGDLWRYRQRRDVGRVEQDGGILSRQGLVSLSQWMNQYFGQGQRRCDKLNVTPLHRLKERLQQMKIQGVLFDEIDQRSRVETDRLSQKGL